MNLNSVYIQTRYPDINEEESTKEESEKDIKTVEKILKWVEKNI
ncbi:MAG: HEPN domain-containing protein [Nanoarchaeota archaeon]|nr:HEPN domain-containing protein [Nanoarchaeota archaeon]